MTGYLDDMGDELRYSLYQNGDTEADLFLRKRSFSNFLLQF